MLDDLSDLKDKGQALLAECAAYAEKNNCPQEAELFKNLSDKNGEMIYQIAIIGFMKRGKSTLLNVLLGRADTTLAPVKSSVCTAAITKYIDISLHPEHKETAIVEFWDGRIHEISYEDLNGYINNKQNNDNEKNVKYIRVYGYFPLVRSSVAIVDTPGKGSVHREHDTITDNFLPMADAILLTQTADLPMEADEKQFLSALPEKEKKKIITVLTKFDTLDNEKDKRESRDFVIKELKSINIPCDRVYCTAAKKVLDARKEQLSDSEVAIITKEAGITDLEQAITDIIKKNTDRNALINHHLNTVESEICKFIAAQKSIIEESLSSFKKNCAELEAEKAKLLKDKKTFEQNCENGKRKFNRNWNRAVEKFCNRLENQKKQQIIDRLTNSVSNADFFSLLQKPKQLPAQVSSMVGAEISDALSDLEEQLEKVITDYSEDMNEGIELYANNNASVSNSKSQLISLGSLGLTGAGIALAANYGIGTVTASMSSITGAWAAAQGSSATVAATSGFAKFFGTKAAVSAATTAAEAQAVAVGTTVTALTSMIGVGICVLFASRLAIGLAKNVQVGNIKSSIPKLVDISFEKIISDVKNQLDSRKEELCSAMSDYVEDELEKREKNIDKLIISIKENDPTYKTKLEINYKNVLALEGKRIELKNELETRDI